MCPNPTRAATVVTVLATLAIAAPALAWPFGDAKPATAAATTTPATTPTSGKTPATGKPTKATPAERAMASRMDPLTRVAFWTKEVDADPTDAEAGLALSATMRILGRYPEATEAAQNVLASHPKYAPALMEIARAQISAGRGFYALPSLKEITVADPRDAKAWALLGVAYDQNKQPELATQAFEQSLRLAPDNPSTLSNYALFRATHGEPQLAEAMLRKAAAQPNAGAAERQNLALVLGLEGKVSEAEPLIRQDLPPEAADVNLAYLRSLAPASAAAAKPGVQTRTWNAVQTSEAAQIGPAPSR